MPQKLPTYSRLLTGSDDQLRALVGKLAAQELCSGHGSAERRRKLQILRKELLRRYSIPLPSQAVA